MLTVSHKIKLPVIAEDFPVEVDGGVMLMPLSARIQSCRDSKASYYKIIIYPFLSTFVTYEGPVSRFHN